MAITTSTLKMIMAAEDRASGLMKKVGGNVAGLAGMVGKTLVGGFLAGGAAATAFTVKAVQAGSDAEEMVAKFDAVFGENAELFTEAFDKMGNELGRNKFELMEWAATLQDTFVPMGFARHNAADLSKNMVQLAVDVASFNNQLESDVVRDFQSAIVGNHETVRKYGIVITQTTLDQELMNMGIEDGISAATEQQKVQARLNLIMEGTKDAHGDAAKTAGSFANQMRGLQAQLSETFTTLGSKLLPVVTPFIGKLSELAIKITPKLVEAFEGKFIPALEGILNLAWMLITGDFEGGIFGLNEDHPFIGGLLKARDFLVEIWNRAKEIDVGELWETAKEKMQPLIDEVMPLVLAEHDKIKNWYEENKPLIEETLISLSDLWENNVKPAIVNFWEETKPVLGLFVDSLLGMAEALMMMINGDWAQGWERLKEVGKESLSGLWDFIGGFMNSVGILIGVDFPAVVEGWKQNFVNFKLIVDLIMEKIDAKIQEKIGSIRDTFNSVKGKIDEVKSKFEGLRNLLSGFSLPDVLTPGSPTPFEEGLIGIGRAMDKLKNRQIPDFQQGMSLAGGGLPALAGGGALAGGRGGAMTINVEIHHNPVVSIFDQNEAERKIIPLIRGAVRQIFKELNTGSGGIGAGAGGV